MFPYLLSHTVERISQTCLLTLTLILTIILTFSPAYAGEYHIKKERTTAKTSELLVCSQCHTMHGSQGSASMVYQKYGVTTGVYIKLLRQATIVQLCLYCHDGNSGGLSPPPPDIWGPTLATGQTNPSAGSLCSGGPDGATPPCSDITTNHTVGAAGLIPIPGTNPVVNLAEFTCVNCHSPHGTTSYRNLRDNGSAYAGITFMATGEAITYSMSAIENNTDYVNILVAPGLGVAKYETSNVLFKTVPTTSTAGIQGFCRSCHNLFHGAGGDSNMGGPETAAPWTRHPTRNTNITTGAANLHADSTCWTTGTAANCAEAFTTRARHIDPDITSTIDGDETPFCLTCHRAHGSTRHSNLVFGAATSLGGAGAKMRDTCQQCHNQ